MVMDRKPFEIVAECEMPRFPTAADVTRVSEQIAAARRARPDIVQAAVTPPAIYRAGRYVLQARLITWAEDVSRAVQAAQGLLADAGLPCRAALPSSRSLVELEIARPSEPPRSARPVEGRGSAAGKRVPKTRAAKAPARGAKGAARRRAR
jgi:hypothetical protein